MHLSFDFFDVNQQGNIQQKQYQILPGDSFRTVCYYKSGDEQVWGIGSRDEMCMR